MREFTIPSLGETRYPSPLKLSNIKDDYIASFVPDDQYVMHDIELSGNRDALNCDQMELVEKAGPREKLFFEPGKVRAGIVTCGGLCPGLNDVIRAVVMNLWYHYSVREIIGYRFGYGGLLADSRFSPILLTPDEVDDIHQHSGTILGSSRGKGDRYREMVDRLVADRVNILFCIGGDGTQKGALAIAREALERGLDIAVVGVPKTIDNDISFVERSFGFETAVSEATRAVSGAHVEAHDAINGIGLVKVMGRSSGFIAAHTALAMNDVNFVLVPEVPFELAGENGLLVHLKKRLERRNHAVILVAEGAGMDLLANTGQKDASGNVVMNDIGLYLKDAIKHHFDQEHFPVSMKYIDPSYMIRSAAAIPTDSIYCARLGSNAVHAAMAGKTAMLVGLVHNKFVHIPTELAVSERKQIDPEGELWRDVLEATGQPALMVNRG